MKFNIAVVGATGRIGSDILTLLGERNFPINKIFALASKKSTGSYACFKNIQIS
jgi:aspartate-semialdehyde dehydrogenase